MSAASSAAPQAPGSSRVWERFTPRQRLSRFAVYLGLVAAIVASARTVEVIPEFLYDAPQQVQDLLERMWPIAWHHYAGGVHDAVVATVGQGAATTVSSNGLVGVGIALSALAVAILGTAFGLKTLASAARSRRG